MGRGGGGGRGEGGGREGGEGEEEGEVGGGEGGRGGRGRREGKGGSVELEWNGIKCVYTNKCVVLVTARRVPSNCNSYDFRAGCPPHSPHPVYTSCLPNKGPQDI